MTRWILLLGLLAAGMTALVLALGGNGGGPNPVQEAPAPVVPGPRPDGGGADPGELETVEEASDLEVGQASGARREAGLQEVQDLEVLVLRANGEPVPYARVHYLDRERVDGWETSWEGRQREAFLKRHGRARNVDEKGRVVLPGTSSGALLVIAAGLRGYHEWDRPLEERVLRLVLESERELRVRVIDHRGRPQPGVRVAIVREFEGRSIAMLTRQTAREGLATFAMVRRVLGSATRGAPRHFVTLGFPCEEPPRVALDPENLPAEPLTLELPPTGSVEVRVLDERGSPLGEVANCSVGRMLPAEGGERVFQPDQNERLVGSSATFSHVGVGTRLAIQLSGSRERADLVEEHDGPSRPGELRRITIRWTDRYPVLLGEAVDGSGERLKGFRGRYTVWGPERGSGGPPLTTDGLGRFRLVIASPLEAQPGRYVECELYARGGQAPLYTRMDLSGELAPGETDLGSVTFRPKPELVTGTVRDVSGEAMTGVHLRVMVEGDADRRSASMTATSLQGGEFTIYGAVEGSFDLVAVRHGYATSRRENLAPGTSGIEMVMEPGGD